MGRFQEWRERQRLASDLAAKVLGTQPYFESGRPGEMLHPLRSWLDQAEAGLGAEHDVTLELRYRLAAALGATGDIAGAGEQAALVVAERERLGRSQILLQAWTLHAAALDNRGRHSEAADSWGALGDFAAKELDRRDVVRMARVRQAAALCHAERYTEAEEASRRLVESAASGAAATSTRLSGLILASVALTGQGRAVEAESAARQGLVVAAADGTEESVANAHVLTVNLAAALSAQGHHTEALELLDAPRPEALTAETVSATAITAARALIALGRPTEAAAALRAALPAAEHHLGPDHIRNRELHTLLARAELTTP